METKYVSFSCPTPYHSTNGSRCHLGTSIVYDTVSNLSWAVDVRKHGIVNVIDNILSEPWKPSLEVGREAPLAEPEMDCVVCFHLLYSWTFADLEWCRSALVGNLETTRKS